MLNMDVLKKEMYNVGGAFEVLNEGVHAPHGCKQVTGHLVWDVKMDFTMKARWVLNVTSHQIELAQPTLVWYQEKVCG